MERRCPARHDNHMIRKHVGKNIGYSVVERGGGRQIFISAAPSGGGDLETQAREVLESIKQAADREGMPGAIVQQAVFLRDRNQIEACRRIVREHYGREMPATTYIAQPPCRGSLLEIEAVGAGRRAANRPPFGADGGGAARRDRFGALRPLQASDDFRRRLSKRFRRFPPSRSGTGRGGVPLRAGDPHLVLPGQYRRSGGRNAALRGVESAQRRLLSQHKLSQRPCNRRGRAGGLSSEATPAIGAQGREVTMSGVALATDRADVLLVPLEIRCKLRPSTMPSATA